MNAVIVDIQAEYAAALCENGSIEKIRNAGYEIGQQIEMDAAAATERSRRRSRSKIVRRMGTMAAALAVAAGLGSGIAYAMPYGTVSLDSEASIEYTINRFNRVIGISAFNEDGSAVLDTIDSRLMHKEIENAVAVTLTQIESDGYLGDETELVITVGTKSHDHSEQLAEQLDETVEDSVSLQAQIVLATMRDVNSAHENQMTVGQKWRNDNITDETGAEGDVQDGTESNLGNPIEQNDADGTPDAENPNGGTGGNAQTQDGESGGNAQFTNADNSGNNGNRQSPDSEADGNIQPPNGESSGNMQSPDVEADGNIQEPNGESSGNVQSPEDEAGGNVQNPDGEANGNQFPNGEGGKDVQSPDGADNGNTRDTHDDAPKANASGETERK